jgi:hypothetical protein
MNANKQILIDGIPETIGGIKERFAPCIKVALKSVLTEKEIDALIDIVLLNLSQLQSISLHSLYTLLCQELKANCIKVKRASINTPTKTLMRILYMSEGYNHIAQALELTSTVSMYVIDTLAEWKDMLTWVKQKYVMLEKILTDLIGEWLKANQSTINELTEHIPDELKEFMQSFEKVTTS